MDSQLTITVQQIESKKLRSKNGEEIWMGRDIQKALGYSKWGNFEKVVEKARMACNNSGVNAKNHFADIVQKVQAGSGVLVPKKDYCLTRYACYLIAMNGDVTKPEIATAQTYFAVQTRRQEVQDMVIAEDRRLSFFYFQFDARESRAGFVASVKGGLLAHRVAAFTLLSALLSQPQAG
jgi:DNA-damage-inducible protein D